MGCCFSNNSVHPVGDTGDELKNSWAPKHLLEKANSLLDETVLRLGEAAHVLKELEQASKPRRPRCKFGENCYRTNPQHLEECSHPGDDDWPNGDKVRAPTAATNAITRDPFATLQQRVYSCAMQAFAALPSQEEVLSECEGDAIILPMAVDDEEVTVPAPLDGSSADVWPHDFVAFASSIAEVSVSGRELRRRVEVVRLVDIVKDSGLLRNENHNTELRDAISEASLRHVRWSEQQGPSAESETVGAGLLYGLMVARWVGLDSGHEHIDVLAENYRTKKGLPAFWTANALASCCSIIDGEAGGGTCREAWFKLEDLLIECDERDTPREPTLFREAAMYVMASCNIDDVKMFVAGVLGSELRTWRPGKPPAIASARIIGEAPREAVGDMASGDPALQLHALAVELDIFAKTLFRDAARDVAKDHLRFALDQLREPGHDASDGALAHYSHYALLVAYRLVMQASMDEADMCSEVQQLFDELSRTFNAERGLPEDWNSMAMMSSYDSAAESAAYARLEDLVLGRILDDPVEPNTIAPTLAKLTKDNIALCIAKALGSADVHWTFIEDDALHEVPSVAWMALAQKYGVESEECVKEGALTAARHHCAIIVEGGGDSPHWPHHLGAAQRLGAETLPEFQAALESVRIANGFPTWWDVAADASASSFPGWSQLRDVCAQVDERRLVSMTKSLLALVDQFRDNFIPALSIFVKMLARHLSRLPIDLRVETAKTTSIFADRSDFDDVDTKLQSTAEFVSIVSAACEALEMSIVMVRNERGFAPIEALEAQALLEKGMNTTCAQHAAQALSRYEADEEASHAEVRHALLILDLLLCASGSKLSGDQFDALAKAYRQQRGLPDSWDVLLAKCFIAGEPALRALACTEKLMSQYEPGDVSAAAEDLREVSGALGLVFTESDESPLGFRIDFKRPVSLIEISPGLPADVANSALADLSRQSMVQQGDLLFEVNDVKVSGMTEKEIVEAFNVRPLHIVFRRSGVSEAIAQLIYHMIKRCAQSAIDVEPFKATLDTGFDGNIVEVVPAIRWYELGVELCDIQNQAVATMLQGARQEVAAELLEQVLAFETDQADVASAWVVYALFAANRFEHLYAHGAEGTHVLDIEAETELAATFKRLCGLPDWFDVHAMLQSFDDRDVQSAWSKARSVIANSDQDMSLTDIESELSDFGPSGKKVLTRVIVMLLGTTPRDRHHEGELFVQYALTESASHTQERTEHQLRTSIPALDLFSKAMSLGTEGEELEQIVTAGFKAAERHLFTYDGEALDYTLYALATAAWLSDQGLSKRLSHSFRELAGLYAGCQSLSTYRPSPLRGNVVSDVAQMALAIARGAISQFAEIVQQEGALDVQNALKVLQHLLLVRDHEGLPNIRVGQHVQLWSKEEFDWIACFSEPSDAEIVRSESSSAKHRKAKAMRKALGQWCKVLEVKHRQSMKILTPDAHEVWLPWVAAPDRCLDDCARAPIVAVIETAMIRAKDCYCEKEFGEDDIIAELKDFQDVLTKGSSAQELRSSMRATALWDLTTKLHLDHEPCLVEASAGIAASAAFYHATSKHIEDVRVALQAGLYTALRLLGEDGCAASAEFKAAADAYRSLLGLPEYWDVLAMVRSYEWDPVVDKGLAPRDIWERAERALRMVDTPEGSEAVGQLLSEAREYSLEDEPWRALHMSCPSDFPKYWTHAGQRGHFDQIVPLPRRDPFGRQTELYPLVQTLLDKTWKFIPTRDRPCPKRADPCEQRAGGCRCVQKDGDPGMPQGLKVRRILRIEDSEMWRNYSKKCEEIAERRKDDHLYALNAKTSEHCTNPAFFRPLEAGPNECYLFHGTFVRAALSISQNNFSIDLAGINVGTMYGRGGYFCECCSKADEYAKDEPDGYYEGVFAMLLCRVAVGKPFVTDKRDEEAGRHTKSGDADSTLGDRESSVNTYREFVVYNKDQVYPEYCILYERVGKGYEYSGDCWGALRRANSKVVLEVPTHWRNAHVDPNEGFSDKIPVPQVVKKFLQIAGDRLHAQLGGGGPKKKAWPALHIRSVARVEDSAMWLSYLSKRKYLQERRCDPFPGVEAALAKAVAGEELTDAKREALAFSLSPSSTVRMMAHYTINVLEDADDKVQTSRKRCPYGEGCYRRNKQHKAEYSHPGDADWEDASGALRREDSSCSIEEDAGLAQIAWTLLESIDQSVNEFYMWCRIPLSSSDELTDGGFQALFTTESDAHFLEVHGTPGAAAFCEGYEEKFESDQTQCVLLFCRVLAGTVCILDSFGTASDVAEEARNVGADSAQHFVHGLEGDDAAKAHAMRRFAVLSPDQVYPEYVVHAEIGG